MTPFIPKDECDFKIIINRGYTFRIWHNPKDKIKFIAEEVTNGHMTQGYSFNNLLLMLDDLCNFIEEIEKQK